MSGVSKIGKLGNFMIQMIMRFHMLEPLVAVSKPGMTTVGSRCAQAIVAIDSASCLASTCQLPDAISFIINWLKALILLPHLDHSIQITVLHIPSA